MPIRRIEGGEYFLSDKLGKTADRSIAEAIKRWLAEEVAHYKSKEKTTSHILQVTDFVLGRTVSEIHVVAEEYAKKHRKLLFPGTINRRLSMLRLIANLCYQKWDWLDKPLGQKIKLLKEKDNHVPLLSQSELNAILDACPNEHSKTAIRLAAYCRLRAAEIQKLRPQHVKKDHLWLAFDQKAGVSIESVPIPSNFKLSPSIWFLSTSVTG